MRVWWFIQEIASGIFDFVTETISTAFEFTFWLLNIFLIVALSGAIMGSMVYGAYLVYEFFN